MSERALLGPSTVMAVGTVTSRVTGVVRDITMTAALGFFLVSDAFSLGNSLPNMIYILVIGGALNAVFIPQLVRKMKDDADGGRAYADRLITLTAIILFVLSVLAIVMAPLIVALTHQVTTQKMNLIWLSHLRVYVYRKYFSMEFTQCLVKC